MNKETGHCISCRNFRNTPQYLESTYKGLSSLSSGFASVRKDDGICVEREIYLSATGSCDRYCAKGEASA